MVIHRRYLGFSDNEPYRKPPENKCRLLRKPFFQEDAVHDAPRDIEHNHDDNGPVEERRTVFKGKERNRNNRRDNAPDKKRSGFYAASSQKGLFKKAAKVVGLEPYGIQAPRVDVEGCQIELVGARAPPEEDTDNDHTNKNGIPIGHASLPRRHLSPRAKSTALRACIAVVSKSGTGESACDTRSAISVHPRMIP